MPTKNDWVEHSPFFSLIVHSPNNLTREHSILQNIPMFNEKLCLVISCCISNKGFFLLGCSDHNYTQCVVITQQPNGNPLTLALFLIAWIVAFHCWVVTMCWKNVIMVDMPNTTQRLTSKHPISSSEGLEKICPNCFLHN